MARPRIGVIGAGFVGMTVAQRMAERELGDVVLFDIIPDMPKGKALDLCESGPVEGYDSRLVGTNSIEEVAGCEIVVITAGLPRKPGMSREDLIDKNAEIVRDVSSKIGKNNPNAIIVTVTNPLDIMTYLCWKVTGFPKQRVIGMAGVLDSARFSYFIAEKMDCSMRDITAMVLGGHGDTMVPLPRYTTVSGIPITDLLPQETIDQLVKRTRDGGAEIVGLLKQGSAYYAPAASVAAMVQSMLHDEKRILPCCVMLEGEYGLSGVCAGVPVKLGRNGVEQVLELKLTADEMKALHASADGVKSGIKHLKL